MSISEADRHQLIRLLSEAITPKGAALLMEHLPPVGWADVAYQARPGRSRRSPSDDLDAHQACEESRAGTAPQPSRGASFGECRDGVVRLEIERAALGDGRAGCSVALGSPCCRAVRTTDAKIDASKYEVLATLRQDMLLQTRTFVLANVAGIFTAVGLAFAAAKLA